MVPGVFAAWICLFNYRIFYYCRVILNLGTYVSAHVETDKGNDASTLKCSFIIRQLFSHSVMRQSISLVWLVNLLPPNEPLRSEI